MSRRAFRFNVLGSLSIRRDGSPVQLTAPKLRQILAALLARANHPVDAESLISVLWSQAPPPAARKSLQVYVHRLRHILGDDEIISHEPAGYSLVIAPGEADSVDFLEQIKQARARRHDGHLDHAAELLGQALHLWRGNAFAGFTDHPLVQDEARLLDEERTRATVEFIELKLDLGHHLDVIAPLRQLIELHPFREDLYGYLMLALYRADRHSDSLDVFGQARVRLAEELGLEPGAALRQLHLAVLRSSPELDLPRKQADVSIPRELPAAVTGFTGRTEQLAALDRSLAANVPAGMPIALISGSAGVGKTALALHWAHAAADQFPDGQIFVDLRSYAVGAHLRPVDALTAMLRSLGVPASRIPVNQLEAAALYRSRIAGRRMLVVIDNASSAADVRPLLPGEPLCRVIVTSRDRLTGLVAIDGAARVPVDVLTRDEAHQLIATLLPSDARASDPRAIAGLADVCAYLPLAIRIALADMLNRPNQTVSEQVTRLREDGPLGVLAIAGDETVAVRTTFALSYQAVTEHARLVFRRLGLVPCPDFSAESVSALADLPRNEAVRALEQLADAHLVATQRDGRYTIHDLLRAYAKETSLREDSPDDRESAALRLSHLFLGRTHSAGLRLYPDAMQVLTPPIAAAEEFVDSGAALQWLDTEHTNIVAVIRHWSKTGPRSAAWQLALYLRHYFDVRRHGALWLTSARAGLAAAHATDDTRAQAAMLHMLGHAYGTQSRYDRAISYFDRALALSKAVQWQEGVALVLSAIGVAKALQGKLDEGVPLLTQSLEQFRRLGSGVPVRRILSNLAVSNWQLGNLEAAHELCREALQTTHSGYDNSLGNLSVILYLKGDLTGALGHVTEALNRHRDRGNRPGESHSQVFRAAMLLTLGRYDEGMASARAAIRLAREIAFPPSLVSGLIELGRYLRVVGDPAGALESLAEATALAERSNIRFELIAALTGLAEAQLACGEPAALETARNAAKFAADGGFKILHGKALVALARVQLATGERLASVDSASEAVEIHRRTRHALGEAEAHDVLSVAVADRHAASGHRKAADAIYALTGAVRLQERLPELGLVEDASYQKT